MVHFLKHKFKYLLGATLVSAGVFAAYTPNPTVMQADPTTLNGTAFQPDGTMLHMTVDNFPATQPVTVSGNVSVSNFPSTQAVTGTFFQSVQPVSGTFFQTIQPVSGTVAIGAGSAAIGSVSVSNFPATQAISATSLPLPTGASTSALQTTGNSSLSSIATSVANIPAQGTATTLHSLPVNIASDQVVPVSGTFFQTTQPVSGTVSVNNFPTTQPVSGTVAVSSLPSIPAGANAIGSVSVSNFPATQPVSGSVSVSNFPATQPVSAVSLPLPTGAATSAKQPALGVAGTPSSDVISVQGEAGMTPLKVDGSGATQPISGSVSIIGTVPVSGTFFQTTQPVSAASLPLPSGASTSALQTTGNTSLSAIQTSTANIPAQGQALAAASLPVVLTAAQLTTLTPLTSVAVNNFPATQPVSGTVAVSNFPASQAVTGTFFQATQPVSAASLPLPAGASTAAKQPALGTAGTASSDVITVQGIASMTALKVDGSGVTQPISGTVTANAGTGTFQTNVTNASIPVTQSGSWTNVVTQPTGTNLHTVVDSGAVAATQSGTWNITNVTGTVSLPTGAATSALQTSGNSTLTTISGQLPATLGSKLVAASLAVNIASDQVVPISATALPLPTGASTSALQTTGNASLAAIDAGIPAALGQTTSAASMPVVLASDQSTIKTTTNVTSSGTPTQTSVSCANTSTTLLAANAATKFISIRNTTSSAVSIWLNIAGAAATTAAPSIDLAPGSEADYFASENSFLPTAQINCISSGTTTAVTLVYK